jgi:hypothetical protein
MGFLGIESQSGFSLQKYCDRHIVRRNLMCKYPYTLSCESNSDFICEISRHDESDSFIRRKANVHRIEKVTEIELTTIDVNFRVPPQSKMACINH